MGVPAGPGLQTGNGVVHAKPKGGVFPRAVAEKGSRTKIQDANASVEADYNNIMRMIAKTPQPPKEHPRFDQVNTAVRTVFLGPATHSCAERGDIECLQRLLKEGISGINHVNSDGSTPTSIAAAHGHTQVIRILAQHGADL